MDKEKKAAKKFDLEKMKVAKLNNLHLINGGNVNNDGIKTITETIVKCTVKD